MGDVVALNQTKQHGADEFAYDFLLNDEGKAIAISHSSWPFEIMRNGDEIALVDADGNPFGILNADVFNTMLYTWLCHDAPDILAKHLED